MYEYSVHLSSDRSQLVMLNAPPSLIEVETMHSYIAQRNAVDVHYETHLLRH